MSDSSRIRDSGMPEESVWAGFFQPEQCLDSLGIDGTQESLVDFGCGFGTFTIPAAQRVRGPVIAIDLDAEMVSLVREKAQQAGLANLLVMEGDMFTLGNAIRESSIDAVLLFNILHLQRPERLLALAHRILKPGGRLAAMHWIHDARTPRGPDLSIRPRPEDCVALAQAAGFSWPDRQTHPLPLWHYGLSLIKPQ